MRLDQWKNKLEKVHYFSISYQFMTRESMRLVRLSSSSLSPAYLADRRWMSSCGEAEVSKSPCQVSWWQILFPERSSTVLFHLTRDRVLSFP